MAMELKGFGGLKMDGKNSFNVLADQKATLMTSRRSFLASSKGIVGAGVALGLVLTVVRFRQEEVQREIDAVRRTAHAF